MASIFGGVDGTCYFCCVKAEIMENMTKREANWQESYKELLAYVEEHGQFPNKKKADKRGLHHWLDHNIGVFPGEILCGDVFPTVVTKAGENHFFNGVIFIKFRHKDTSWSGMTVANYN